VEFPRVLFFPSNKNLWLYNKNGEKGARNKEITMDELNLTPVEQLASILLNDGQPEILPEEVKKTFCEINSMYLDQVKPEDNFFHQVISKYFTQLCMDKDVYVKSVDKFEIKNLKKASVYLIKYVSGTKEFKTYVICKSGDKLLTGGGEFYQIFTRIICNKGCLHCNFNEHGCEECNNESINAIISQLPDEFVNGPDTDYYALCNLFDTINIEVVTDFFKYYVKYINSLDNIDSDNSTTTTKSILKHTSKNKLLEGWFRKISKLDVKVLHKIKSFISELLTEYKTNPDLQDEFKNCKNIDRTLVFVIQTLIKLSNAVKSVKADETPDQLAVMEVFLQNFFES
jgi:hypothetical protein